MYVNITFVIQVINFGITYWFLNRFFFKPFLASLTLKKEQSDSLNTFLVTEQKTLEALEEERRAKLVNFQRYLKKEYSIPEVTTPRAEYDMQLEPEDKNIDKLIDDAKKVLIKKVTHEY